MAAKSFPGKQWGNDQSNANDAPDWRYVESEPVAGHSPNIGLTGNATANLVATTKGWELVHPDSADGGQPWASEVVVAIGGLKMPALTVLSVADHSGALTNAANQVITVQLQMSSGVNVADANTSNVYVVAIGDVFGGVANVNVGYSAALSAPESGVLVFQKTVDLSSYQANDSYTINSTSTFHGVVNSRKQKDGVLAMTATIPGSTVIVF